MTLRTYRLPSRLRLNGVCQGLPATSSIMGHPDALERETIDSLHLLPEHPVLTRIGS